MTTSSSSHSSARWLLLTGLAGIGYFAGREVQAFTQSSQNWDRLLSDAALLTVGLYVVLFVVGLAILLIGWFFPEALRRLAKPFEKLRLLRWLAVAAAFLSIAWFYLYSAWQGLWPGPWTQFILALGVAAIVAWLVRAGERSESLVPELPLAMAIFLYPRIVIELRVWYKLAIIYRGATLLGYLGLIALALWLFTPAGHTATDALIRKRNELTWARWPLGAALICGPLICFALAGGIFFAANPAIRFSLLLLEFYALAFLLDAHSAHALSLKSLVLSAFALALGSFVANSLLLVVNYPFSLSWSEGNRFYDYSLPFGQALYEHAGTITNPYGQPGRYILWAILFLWPKLPIQVHRFWNIVLLTVPPLVVGWLAVRKLADSFLRVGMALFIALLFTVLSPLHPPFLVAAALALLFIYDSSLVRRGIAIAIASFFVGTSRWTWIPVTAAWGILGDLILYYPARQGSLLKRLQPTLILTALGLLPGLISGYSGIPLSSTGLGQNQPLLWYRLLPNPTFPLGVLFGTLLISGPAMCILVWWVSSRRFPLDWLQQLAVWGALIGFLGAGLVVSTKIGGGADLHNLDMYLMTLVLVLALGLYSMSKAGPIDFLTWPVWTQLLVGFMILYPLYPFTPFSAGAAQNPLSELAKPQDVTRTLAEIQSQVDGASTRGDVLFMDQRQLLTFGYIHNVQFVQDYEKKYMMDQAMAANSPYFQQYYQDLARQRFQLIVTEILHTRQESGADFSEENNAWVKWISEPTLCFYEPSFIDKDLNVELLVPKPHPLGCDAYLHAGE